MKSEKTYSGVQSLEVGLSIFDVLANSNDSMMLKDIAETLSMHPAKVHRYLVSLIKTGYARQTDSGRYGLGDKTLVLGLKAVRTMEHLQLARQDLLDLQKEVNTCIQVAKWTALGPLIIQFLEPDHPVLITARVGSIMPMTRSATGHIFASYLAEDIVRPLMEKEWDSGLTIGTASPLNWTEFVNIKKQIKQSGFSAIEGNLINGVNAIGAPIFDVNGELILSITCMGSSEHIDIKKNSMQIKAIMHAAEKISAQFGYSIL